MMCLFLMASTFFHSARCTVDRGDLHQELSAWYGMEGIGLDFFKHKLFVLCAGTVLSVMMIGG